MTQWGGLFIQNSDLKKHKMTHTVEKPYPLQQMIISITTGLPTLLKVSYLCSQCGNAFTQIKFATQWHTLEKLHISADSVNRFSFRIVFVKKKKKNCPEI